MAIRQINGGIREMKKWLMQELSRSSGWHIGIYTRRQRCYYLVSSRTGVKYRPWVGVVALILMVLLMLVMLFSFLGIAAFPAEYGFSYWPVSVGMVLLTYGSWKAFSFLHSLFEERPDLYDEDYEPTEEELKNWDKCVH